MPSTPATAPARSAGSAGSAGRAPRAEQLRILVSVAGLGVRLRAPLTAVLSALVVGLALLTGALWPSLRDTFTDLPSGLLDTLQDALAGADLTTRAGWVTAEMLSIVAPAAVVAAGVLTVSSQLAGSEETHRLALVAATPVCRVTYLAGVGSAAALHVLLVSAAVVLGLVVADPIGSLGLTASGILGSGLHLLALGLCFTGVALLVAALSGRSRTTGAISGGLGGLALVATVFLPLSDALADGAKASPWYYYSSSDPLSNGTDPAHVLVLAVVALVLTGLAAVALRRRDLAG